MECIFCTQSAYLVYYMKLLCNCTLRESVYIQRAPFWRGNEKTVEGTGVANARKFLPLPQPASSYLYMDIVYTLFSSA